MAIFSIFTPQRNTTEKLISENLTTNWKLLIEPLMKETKPVVMDKFGFGKRENALMMTVLRFLFQFQRNAMQWKNPKFHCSLLTFPNFQAIDYDFRRRNETSCEESSVQKCRKVKAGASLCLVRPTRIPIEQSKPVILIWNSPQRVGDGGLSPWREKQSHCFWVNVKIKIQKSQY